MFDKLFKLFNNREISIFIWVVILVAILISKKETRQSVISVIQAFFKLSNLYSFNLVIELISIPILVFTGAMLAFSENKSEYKSVHKVFNGLLILYGLGVIIISIMQISDNIDSILRLKKNK